MFNIGGGELIVIALLALIVLGPQRLPDAARQIGKTLGDLRRLSSSFQDELRGALDDDPHAARTPRRDVLGGSLDAPPASDRVRDAVRSVSDQASSGDGSAAAPRSTGASGARRRRTTPLVAEPTSNGTRPAAGSGKTARRSSTRSRRKG